MCWNNCLRLVHDVTSGNNGAKWTARHLCIFASWCTRHCWKQATSPLKTNAHVSRFELSNLHLFFMYTKQQCRKMHGPWLPRSWHKYWPHMAVFLFSIKAHKSWRKEFDLVCFHIKMATSIMTLVRFTYISCKCGLCWVASVQCQNKTEPCTGFHDRWRKPALASKLLYIYIQPTFRS